MDLPIAAFGIMAEIAKENKVNSIKWARSSGLSPSRISDFKRMAKITKAGAAESDEEREVGGHIFALKHFFTLWDGLRRLVGVTALRKGLIRQLETKKVSTRVRIFLRLMTFTDGHPRLVDAFADAILQQFNTSTNRGQS